MISTTLRVDDLADIEPLQKYILSDKSKYIKASNTINPRTGRNYIDPDGDFLIGESGGFLMNIEFTFTSMHLFRKSGITYDKHSKFTFFENDTYEYDKFVETEEYRREYGMTKPCKVNRDGTITDLHITGEHYNFINYGLIEKLDRTSVGSIYDPPKKNWGTPEPFDSQYWVFKVKAFAKANGFNLIILKSRRKGMSYIEGVGSANTINLKPGVVVIHAAYDKKFLIKGGAISQMSKKQLNFYEFNTPFVRGSIKKDGSHTGLLKKDIEELITGYKDNSQNSRGDQSTLFTVSTMNNADVAVGKAAIEVKCDELNTFPNFSDFMQMTNPTTTTGAFKTGIITAFGTGGTKAGNWAEFEKHYFNTEVYDFMPFENIWDENSTDELTGYFLPYWWGLEGVDADGNWSMDADGNTNYEVAIAISDLERENKLRVLGHGSDFINYCSQYANRSGEAFNSGTTKVLSSLELKQHIKNVRTKKKFMAYQDGWVLEEKGKVIFKSNTQLASENFDVHPFIEDVPFKANTDLHGCLRMHHTPFRDETGEIPKNLYFTTYDPYAADIEDNEITTAHSLAAVQVWMYPNNISYSAGKILVASWVGRLNSTEAGDIACIAISKLYNADCLAEMDRGTMLATAKKFNFVPRLISDPTSVTSKEYAPKKRSIGMIIGNTSRKLDGVVLLKDLIYEPISTDEDARTIYRFETITDLPTLIEYDKFSHRGNYDRVSCSILAAYQINAYITLKLKPSTRRNTIKLHSALKKIKI